MFTQLMKFAMNGDMSEIKRNDFGKPYVDAVDETGKNALMFAAIWDRAEVVEWLIMKKVNLNAVDNDGKTALDYAKEKLNYKIERILEEAIERRKRK